MEVSGTVFRPLPSLFGSGVEFYSNSPASLSVQILGSRRRSRRRVTNSGFSDMGHIHYYSSDPKTRGRIRCGSGKIDMNNIAKDKDMIKDEKKKKKKRLKLVKSLSRDLSMFSDLGFVLDNHDLDDQLKGNIISEATELLLGQLQQLKAEEEEEEMKRKRKEEKAKQKAAARMQKRLNCEMSSSSSLSSESSDSECREVVDMISLNCVAALAPPVVIELQPVMQETSPLPNSLTEEASAIELQSVIREAHATLTIPSTTNLKVTSTEEEGGITGSCLHRIQQPCFSTQTTTTTTNCNGGMAGGEALSTKKVEVCMGGKCKKSGAASLLDEFQRVLGAEASVVGCKCMGKCRDGPNVRILNYSGVQAECVDDSVRVPSNPLCIGVGLEDVGSIVANFLGEKHKDRGLAAAP